MQAYLCCCSTLVIPPGWCSVIQHHVGFDGWQALTITTRTSQLTKGERNRKRRGRASRCVYFSKYCLQNRRNTKSVMSKSQEMQSLDAGKTGHSIALENKHCGTISSICEGTLCAYIYTTCLRSQCDNRSSNTVAYEKKPGRDSGGHTCRRLTLDWAGTC